jgi:hypothetical protein
MSVSKSSYHSPRIVSFFSLLLRPSTSQVWWGMPVIPALGKWRQENHKLKPSVGYIVRPCLQKKLQLIG